MITETGIDKVEVFLLDTIQKMQFVTAGGIYDAQSMQVERITEENRLLVIGVCGQDLPVGVTVSQVRLLDKSGEIFAVDAVNMHRTDIDSGLYYGFNIAITQQGG